MSEEVDLLTTSLGHYVGVESRLTEWPSEAFAYYQEIPAKDLREGMENIFIEVQSHAITNGRLDSTVLNEMGVITEVVLKEHDGEQHLSILHRLANDTSQARAHRQYPIKETSSNWIQTGRVYQKHIWQKMGDKAVNELDFSVLKGLTLRLDEQTEHGYVSVVAELTEEEQLANLRELINDEARNNAVYWLHPKPIKVFRQAEAIPPMPGEKPQPSPQGDGEQPGQPGDKTPDIPPMPGSGHQRPDATKRGETTELGDGWWGTGRGEN